MILNIMRNIGDLYLKTGVIENLLKNILLLIGILKTTSVVLGFFWTRKFKKAKKNHKYAICIAARNEEKVIGNLLESINMQKYPKELITTFVIADNCTDHTKEVAEKNGAIVYERFDEIHKTKGFALQYLFKNIEKDYGTKSFEGYFIFDADNLLKEDYIEKMNNAFDSGCKIITSYRNSKNFDENVIASTYALHWLRSIRFNHRGRSVMRLATNIQGTGFLFANEIVSHGWNYTSLTEDRALTADAVAQGYQITYQNEAMFYDEQPVSLKIALRQRLRWSKGHLQAFVETGPFLFINIFFGKLFVRTKWVKEEKKKEKLTVKRFFLGLVESIRHRIASFDTLAQVTPVAFISFIKWVIISLILYAIYSYYHGIVGVNLFMGNNIISKVLRSIINIDLNLEPGTKAMFVGLLLSIWFRIIYRLGVYLSTMLMALYVFIFENKKIKKIKLSKKILFIITFPIFDMIGRITTFIAVFKKVKWDPIPHESTITINDIKKD